MNVTAQDMTAKLVIGAVLLAGLLLALYAGIAVSESSYYNLVFLTAGIGLAVWVVVARDRWWLPFPVSVALGGIIYVGFRIYLHELMLAFCLLPLVVNIMARKEMMVPLRQRIPLAVFLLGAYLMMHWVGCMIFNQVQGFGGLGMTSRRYMDAAWPLIIFFAFYLYGNSRHLRTALACMFWMYALRVGFGLWVFLTTPEDFNPMFDQRRFIYLPILNYVPTFGTSGDLRHASIGLASLTLAYASLARLRVMKVLFFGLAVGCLVINLLGGGRVTFVACVFLFVVWAFFARQFLILTLVGLLGICLLTVLNVMPESIENLPRAAQRSLSGLVFTDDGLAIKQATSDSDAFHARLRQAGFERWSHDLSSILVGHGVRPFDEAAWTDEREEDVFRFSEQAKLTGRYEKGFWDVTATFGAVGLLLYLNLMRFLLWDAAIHLWRNGIRDLEHAFFFLATFFMVNWFCIMFVSGGFPSMEILFGLFAKVAYEDSQRRARLKAGESAAPPAPAAVPG